MEYTGLERFIEAALGRGVSEIGLAREIQTTLYGEDAVRGMSDERLLTALEYGDVTQKTEYIRVSANGTATYMTREAMLADISQARAARERAPMRTAISDAFASSDGYMQAVTTAAARAGNPSNGKYYYTMSTNWEWLILPLWRMEDVIALSWGSALFDSSMTEYASITEGSYCAVCGETFSSTYAQTRGAGNYIVNSPQYQNHVDISYSLGGGGVAANVKFSDNLGTCIHGEGEDIYNGTVMNHMSAFLQGYAYSEGADFSVASGYCHRKSVFTASIGATLLPNGELSFTVSPVIATTKYVARPIVVDV